MFKSIWDDIKLAFHQGNMVIRLIFINVAVFVIMAIMPIFVRMFVGGSREATDKIDEIIHWFCMSDDWYTILIHPWSIFTHMFLHTDFFHILMNMLFLYWFGRITGDLLGDRHILPLYLLGGLVGALAYFLSAILLPEYYGISGFALGASAAVMAIVAAAGISAPDYVMNLLLFGPVRLKFIVITLIVIDLVGIGGLSNTGGHFAHLGGLLMGFVYVNQLRTKGTDLSVPVNGTIEQISTFFTNIFSSKKKPTVAYKRPNAARHASRKGSARTDNAKVMGSHQEQLDTILDKIKDKGYESLSQEEKEFLFNASKE